MFWVYVWGDICGIGGNVGVWYVGLRVINLDIMFGDELWDWDVF